MILYYNKFYFLNIIRKKKLSFYIIYTKKLTVVCIYEYITKHIGGHTRKFQWIAFGNHPILYYTKWSLNLNVNIGSFEYIFQYNFLCWLYMNYINVQHFSRILLFYLL